MKKDKLFVMLEDIEKLKDIKNIKFAYCLAKNKNKILNEVELIKSSLRKLSVEEDKTYKEYITRRKSLLDKCSNRDKNGKVIIEDGIYSINDVDNFIKDNAVLEEQFNDTITKVKDVNKKNKDFLDSELEDKIIFSKINLSEVPDEISLSQIQNLMDLIEED